MCTNSKRLWQPLRFYLPTSLTPKVAHSIPHCERVFHCVGHFLVEKNMKTSQQGVLSPRAIQQKRTTPFLGKIVKPHVFSQIIQSHGSVIQQSNHRTIVSHQILNPEYNPQSPQLKVEIPPSPTAGASHASVSSSTGSPHLHSNRKLPARSPLNTRSDIRSSSSSASSDIQRSPSDMNRPTTLELEKILIEEKAALKKMQMEAEAVS